MMIGDVLSLVTAMKLVVVNVSKYDIKSLSLSLFKLSKGLKDQASPGLFEV